MACSRNRDILSPWPLIVSQSASSVPQIAGLPTNPRRRPLLAHLVGLAEGEHDPHGSLLGIQTRPRAGRCPRKAARGRPALWDAELLTRAAWLKTGGRRRVPPGSRRAERRVTVL